MAPDASQSPIEAHMAGVAEREATGAPGGPVVLQRGPRRQPTEVGEIRVTCGKMIAPDGAYEVDVILDPRSNDGYDHTSEDPQDLVNALRAVADELDQRYVVDPEDEYPDED